MSNTIAQLFNGTLDPVKYLGKNHAEMRELEELMCRHIKILDELLTSEAAAAFEKFNDCLHEYACYLAEQAFCDGFALGTKLSTEALCRSVGTK